jgi:hypothetical protein
VLPREKPEVGRGVFQAPILRPSFLRPLFRHPDFVPFSLRMSTPVFRRLANPLSIWIALLAIVLQSVMPMVAQARMHAAVPAVVAASAAHGAAPQLAMAGHHGQTHANAHAGAPPPASAPANPHAMHGDAPCPYCRVHLDAVALPLLPNPHWVLLVSVVHRAIEIEALPALPEAWSPTRPRGPPVLS